MSRKAQLAFSAQNIATLTITPSRSEKLEWARMAQEAYNTDRNDIGHKFSSFAALREGEAIRLTLFDELMRQYRSWLFHGFDEGSAQ